MYLNNICFQQLKKIQVMVNVLTTKTGLIIGKEGKTIRQISAGSGADCHLDRESRTAKLNHNVFVVRGTSEEVKNAQIMISEILGSVSKSIIKGSFYLIVFL